MFSIVVGTRPSFIMAAPVIRAFDDMGVPLTVLHSGQHYSDNMDRVFFEQLNLREPDVRIDDTRSASTTMEQLSRIMVGVESFIEAHPQKAMLVLGDTNSNLGAAIAARKSNIPIGHIEAGERSGDMTAAEEQNRVIIDRISALYFATNEESRDNLLKEGLDPAAIHVTGNPIVDSLWEVRGRAMDLAGLGDLAPGLDLENFALCTLHRQEHVDKPELLKELADGLKAATRAANTDLMFVMHPRTANALNRFGLMEELTAAERIHCVEAIGYLEFAGLLARCRFVITDSGGVNQEACCLGVPSVTVAMHPAWPVTIRIGASVHYRPGLDSLADCAQEAAKIRDNDAKWPQVFGDGTTGVQIAKIVRETYSR